MWVRLPPSPPDVSMKCRRFGVIDNRLITPSAQVVFTHNVSALTPTALLAISLLAGWGGLNRSQQLFPTASPASVAVTPDISFKGEKLDTKAVTMRPNCASQTWDTILQNGLPCWVHRLERLRQPGY
jgi:hypothetical protein